MFQHINIWGVDSSTEFELRDGMECFMVDYGTVILKRVMVERLIGWEIFDCVSHGGYLQARVARRVEGVVVWLGSSASGADF